MIDIRRKSTELLTNFFQSNQVLQGQLSDLEYYEKYCPIERSYQGSEYCSGSYNNGAFQFYPTFAKSQCQCKSMLKLIDDLSDNEDVTDIQKGLPPVFYAEIL